MQLDLNALVLLHKLNVIVFVKIAAEILYDATVFLHVDPCFDREKSLLGADMLVDGILTLKY